MITKNTYHAYDDQMRRTGLRTDYRVFGVLIYRYTLAE